MFSGYGLKYNLPSYHSQWEIQNYWLTNNSFLDVFFKMNKDIYLLIQRERDLGNIKLF